MEAAKWYLKDAIYTPGVTFGPSFEEVLEQERDGGNPVTLDGEWLAEVPVWAQTAMIATIEMQRRRDAQWMDANDEIERLYGLLAKLTPPGKSPGAESTPLRDALVQIADRTDLLPLPSRLIRRSSQHSADLERIRRVREIAREALAAAGEGTAQS